MKSALKLLVAGVAPMVLAPQLKAQSTAFTYQGRLNDGASPTTGTYDLKFAIYDTAVSGNAVSSPLTNTAISVTNGLFTTTLDFGNVFNGANRWLEIAVRTNGAISFATLSPRQLLTAAPYAMYAANAATAVTANNIGSLNSANIAQLNVLGTSSQAMGAPVVTSGFVTSANVTYGGSGYTTPPLVTVSDSTGSNAVITANISSGVVVSFTVFNAGHGYSSVATLTVGLPPEHTASQTFSGLNNFSGVNTMTNPNNVFVGSFYGNGAGWTNVPVSGVAAWQIVSGTNLQALPNAGYLLTNNALVTVALPVAPNVGDVVRVSGSGAGGWKLAQNAGQTIIVGDVQGTSWKSRLSLTDVVSVASSADGVKLAAAGYGNRIFTSADSGITWMPQTNSPATNWVDVASSADGTKLVGVAVGSGNFSTYYTSIDSGATWTPRATNQESYFNPDICSSADGTKLAAIVRGRVSTSSNSGITWTPQAGCPTNCHSLACSADGTKLVAGVDNDPTSNFTIFTSTDSGVTWTPRAALPVFWYSICSSADGAKLAGVGDGQIYTSTDSGVTWVRLPDISGAYTIASSADGVKLVAGADDGPVYLSTDSGSTWTPQFASPEAYLVVSSSDGNKLALVNANLKKIYTYSSRSTGGVTGFLQGNQKSAAELQYIGNGEFMLIGYAGVIRAY